MTFKNRSPPQIICGGLIFFVLIRFLGSVFDSVNRNITAGSIGFDHNGEAGKEEYPSSCFPVAEPIDLLVRTVDDKWTDKHIVADNDVYTSGG